MISVRAQQLLRSLIALSLPAGILAAGACSSTTTELCPDTAPAVGSACSNREAQCAYPICGDAEGDRYRCSGGAWRREYGSGQACCPATQPTDCTPCDLDPSVFCTYPGTTSVGRTSGCRDGVWVSGNRNSSYCQDSGTDAGKDSGADASSDAGDAGPDASDASTD